MTKKNLAMIMEWLRPVGIGLTIFFAYYFGRDAISRFHVLGPFVVILMSGTVAFESLILGEVASEKIGYEPHRAYQIQSGLANAATAMTALLVYALDWGRYADATIVTVMLMFFTFSAANHTATAIMAGNMKLVIQYCIQDDTMIYTQHGGAPWRDRCLSETKKFNEPNNYEIKPHQLQTIERPFRCS